MLRLGRIHALPPDRGSVSRRVVAGSGAWIFKGRMEEANGWLRVIDSTSGGSARMLSFELDEEFLGFRLGRVWTPL